MSNYLTRLGKPAIEVLETKGERCLCKKGDVFTIDEMVPIPGFCPFAYHNLIPYIVTLLHDGWFRWTKKEKDISSRYLRTVEYFRSSSVNRAFPNEVLVQCPNSESAIVIGVGIRLNNEKKSITLRVLHQEGLCYAGHKKGDEFTVEEDDIKFSLLVFNALFPYMALNSFGGDVRFRDLKGNISVKLYNPCCEDPELQSSIIFKVGNDHGMGKGDCFLYKSQSIKTRVVKSPCRYHSSPGGIVRIARRGLCLDAFHAIYPYALAMLYDANFNNDDTHSSVSICCPSPKYKVVFKIKRIQAVSNGLKALKNILAKIFETFFYPIDVINYKVIYSVSDIHGKCPAGHKIGEQFEFNLWDKEELCPASFHSVFPFLLLENQGIPFRWKDGSEACEVSCPDCQGAVYQL